MKNIRNLLFAAVIGSSAIASANAFNINEHDARVTGRGGATAATNTSPSSMVFNPGGMAVGEGTSFLVNGAVYIAQGSYEPLDSDVETKTDSPPAYVPSLYLMSRVHDMVAIGISFHLPFGLHVSWPTNHAQAETIVDQTLRTYFITPSVGLNLYKYVPGLSVGGGLDIVPATVELEQAIVAGTTRGNAHLGGDAVGIGGRIGVMYRPPSATQLKLGVMWRSQVNLDFSGEGDFDIEDPFRPLLPPDGNIATDLKLPQAVWGGIAYSVIPELELEFDAVWIDWSKFQEIRIELPDGSETVSLQNYEDTVTLRFGAEYTFDNTGAVRAGFIYDPTPIPPEFQTARLPDVNRKNVTLGGSLYFGEKYGAHVGFLWVTPGERETSMEPFMPVFKGRYGVHAFVTSLMFSGNL